MTAWTSILNSAVAVGGIPSSATVTALRDNPIAMAESASGSPINVMGWHPVDKVTVGDGKDGLLFSHATSGTQANVTSPNFEDGYEYRIFGADVSHNDASSRSLIIELYKQTTATWVSIGTFPAVSSGSEVYFDTEIVMPRIDGNLHFARAIFGSAASTSNVAGSAISATFEKVLNVRVRFAAGSIDKGKIWLFRRREYASSP